MRDIPAEAALQFGVFTTEQAGRCGWTRSNLEYAVRTNQLIRLRRGCYALPAGPPNPDSADPTRRAERRALLHCATAASLTVSGAVISHTAAAVADGLPLLNIPAVGCITLRPGVRTQQHELHLHRQRLPPVSVRRSGGLLCTKVARTCLDIACEHGLHDGVVAADAALHAGLMTKEDLLNSYQDLHRTPGSAAAREVCDLSDHRSESPLESLSRLGLRGLGMLAQLQVPLYGRDYRFLARADFFWPGLAVVGEADGALKYGPGALYREKLREDELTAHNLVVVRWGWREAMNPVLLEARVRSGLAKAQSLRLAGLMPLAHWDVRPSAAGG